MKLTSNAKTPAEARDEIVGLLKVRAEQKLSQVGITAQKKRKETLRAEAHVLVELAEEIESIDNYTEVDHAPEITDVIPVTAVPFTMDELDKEDAAQANELWAEMRKNKTVLFDPPNGSRYGFPKPLPDDFTDETIKDMLRAAKYPEKDIEFAMQYAGMMFVEKDKES